MIGQSSLVNIHVKAILISSSALTYMYIVSTKTHGIFFIDQWVPFLNSMTNPVVFKCAVPNLDPSQKPTRPEQRDPFATTVDFSNE